MKRFIRAFLFITALIFFIWFTIPIFTLRIINPGNILGIIICIYILIWGGFNSSYIKFKERLCRLKAVRIIWKCLNVLIGIFVAYAVIISALMVNTAFFTPPPENSTAIVLGAQVKPWGPSTLLQQRIDAAVKYMNDNPGANAVVTGGKGDDEIMSEAQCMYENMVKQGTDAKRIYKEDKATNTKENLLFSCRIIEDNNLNKNLAVVTDSYHQLRTRIILNKLNINTQAGSVNTVNGRIGIVTYPTFFVREWIAIPFELIK